jgi:hypothetical protein
MHYNKGNPAGGGNAADQNKMLRSNYQTTTVKTPTLSTLLSADVICNDCGTRYGKYSVGCSSRWEGTCDVCGERKGVTEVRDYGYLQKGITELKNQKPIMTDEELDEVLAPYESGEITLKLTEEEVAFLNECLDTIVENHPTLCPGHTNEDPSDVPLFEGIEKKITALYEDNCVKYSLAPAMKAYIARYGAIPGPDDDAKWEIFRDAYNMGASNG